jgi:hypothetical protein
MNLFELNLIKLKLAMETRELQQSASAPTLSERSQRYEICECFQTPGVNTGESFVCVCALADGHVPSQDDVFVRLEMRRLAKCQMSLPG